ncbi:hypothetical protein J4Q44_G00189610 [Coregonus suidteri]|uniref:Uncharacterized protein n=1 Tax=Coregonus suidteri TaxID=861788 RepID=A0AAN8M1B7_9TELE
MPLPLDNSPACLLSPPIRTFSFTSRIKQASGSPFQIIPEPCDPSPNASPWTTGSAAGERGCSVLEEEEEGSAVRCCSPSHTLSQAHRGGRDREKEERTSEPKTLGSLP